MSNNATFQSPIYGKVLVAEDDTLAQKAILDLLLLLGFPTQWVSNGTMAVQWALQEQGNFCLILMDCDMPDLDGFSAARMIRESELGTDDHVPIIGLIETGSRGSVEDCFASGMDDCIPKPVSVDEIKRVLQKWPKPLKKSSLEPSFPEPLITNGEESPLNYAMLDGIRELQPENEPDVLTELIGIYLRKSEELIGRIHQAITERNYVDLRTSIHNLKGSSGTLGAQRLSDCCHELLHALENQVPFEVIEKWLPRLEAEHALAYRALRAEQKQ